MRLRPSSSTATVLEKVEDTHIPTMLSRGTEPRSIKRLLAEIRASHHSWQSCSAPPSGRKNISVFPVGVIPNLSLHGNQAGLHPGRAMVDGQYMLFRKTHSRS